VRDRSAVATDESEKKTLYITHDWFIAMSQ